MNSARETFSEKSHEYMHARPLYPAELFEWIANQCASHDVAWDCAAGNGQAAVGLSPYFKKVFATDISSEQIEHAMHRDNIEYSVQSAESTSFADQAFDVIAVAQALHWFDYPRFWSEVMRVGRPGALFVAWGYDWLNSTPEVDSAVVVPFREVIAPFWAPNNMLLWNGYRSEEIEFPFRRIATPEFFIKMQWSLDELLAYMMTWSAFKRSRADSEAVAAMDQLLERAHALALPSMRFAVRMPLKMVAGYVSSPDAQRERR